MDAKFEEETWLGKKFKAQKVGLQQHDGTNERNFLRMVMVQRGRSGLLRKLKSLLGYTVH